MYPMPLVVRGDASEMVLTWSEAGVTHRPCPQGPIFDRRPRPSAEDRARRDAEQIVEALAENRDRPPFLHGLRRRLYPEQLWWRYLTRRCLG